VKDIHSVGKKMTKRGLKTDIWHLQILGITLYITKPLKKPTQTTMTSVLLFSKKLFCPTLSLRSLLDCLALKYS